MNKNTIIVLSLSLIVILGLVVARTPKDDVAEASRQEQVLSQAEVKGSTDEDKVVLYYGSTCPHCKVAEEWLEKNPEIKEKSGLVAKEVYENQENSRELTEKAQECQIGESRGIGVPFLYDKGECIVGDQLIISHLVKYPIC